MTHFSCLPQRKHKVKVYKNNTTNKLSLSNVWVVLWTRVHR